MKTGMRRAGYILFAMVAAFGLLMSGGAARTLAYQDATDRANAGAKWIEGQQLADGSFPGFGAGSTIDAVLALISVGADPASYVKGGNSPVSFLASKAPELAKTPGGAGKLLIAVASLGQDATMFGGVDLLAAINAGYDAKTGQYGKDAIGHAFAMIGLHVSGREAPAEAAAALKGLQAADGGWAFSGEKTSGASDTNTTAVVVQALIAAREEISNPAMQKALAYLRGQQNADGGFPYQKGGEFGSDSDVNSTSYVVQALLVLGETGLADKAKAFLAKMQKANGAFQWKADEPDDNAGATYQAIPALLDTTLILPLGNRVTSSPVGMPATGAADWMIYGVITALSTLLLAGGTMVRRKAL